MLLYCECDEEPDRHRLYYSELVFSAASINVNLFIISHRIDDIQDNSMRRDGVPVAYRVYGTSTTLNSVGFGYFLAMKKAAELHPDVRSNDFHLFLHQKT